MLQKEKIMHVFLRFAWLHDIYTLYIVLEDKSIFFKFHNLFSFLHLVILRHNIMRFVCFYYNFKILQKMANE